MNRKKSFYEVSSRKLENILSEALRSAGTCKQVDFERFMRRALRHIGVIKNTAPNNPAGDQAMVKAYKIYGRLQRLCNYPQYFADNTRRAPDRVVRLDQVAPKSIIGHTARPASLRWDVAAMMAAPKGGADRNWWRPPKRRAPVKHYTREELENEYPAFTISKNRETDP